MLISLFAHNKLHQLKGSWREAERQIETEWADGKRQTNQRIWRMESWCGLSVSRQQLLSEESTGRDQPAGLNLSHIMRPTDAEKPRVIPRRVRNMLITGEIVRATVC